MVGCLIGSTADVTVAGTTQEWSAATDMVSDSAVTTACGPMNAGYSGDIVLITRYFGVLTVDPSGCSPKSCATATP